MTAVLPEFNHLVEKTTVSTVPCNDANTPTTRDVVSTPLSTSSTTTPEILSASSLSSSSSPPTPGSPHHLTGKIFVGGLSWETDEDSLRAYYSKFGVVTDCVIMRDRHTGHPRGFGFVTYAEEKVALRVSKERHELDGRVVEAKLAVPKCELAPPTQRLTTNNLVRANANHTITNKVFVGGLPATCVDTDLQVYFQRFGQVAETQVMYDHQTGNSRGFGFVTFVQDETVEHVVNFKNHEIMSKYIEVKRAEPRQVMDARRSRNETIVSASIQQQQQQQQQHSTHVQNLSGNTTLAENSSSTRSPFSSSAHFSTPLSSSPTHQSVFSSVSYPSVSTTSPWDQPVQPGKPAVWSTGYLEGMNNHAEDLADVLHKVMYGKGATKTLGSYGFRLAAPVRSERRYHPYT